jgi:hypothetical protein
MLYGVAMGEQHDYTKDQLYWADRVVRLANTTFKSTGGDTDKAVGELGGAFDAAALKAKDLEKEMGE